MTGHDAGGGHLLPPAFREQLGREMTEWRERPARSASAPPVTLREAVRVTLARWGGAAARLGGLPPDRLPRPGAVSNAGDPPADRPCQPPSRGELGGDRRCAGDDGGRGAGRVRGTGGGR